jgi:hypothetical protein
MADFAIEAGIWKKAGSRVEIHDGSKVYQKNIYEDTDKYFTPEVMKAIDEYVGRKFLYGSAFDDIIEDEEEKFIIPKQEEEDHDYFGQEGPESSAVDAD